MLAVDGQGKRLYASGNHEINDGLGAVINGAGAKSLVLIDVDTGKKTLPALLAGRERAVSGLAPAAAGTATRVSGPIRFSPCS